MGTAVSFSFFLDLFPTCQVPSKELFDTIFDIFNTKTLLTVAMTCFTEDRCPLATVVFLLLILRILKSIYWY